MRDDYKLKGATVKIEVEIEKAIAEILEKMEKYCPHSKAELVNTALRRFVSHHKDFLPPQDRR